MTTEHTGGSFRQIKKKTIQFKCGRLLVNDRDLPSVKSEGDLISVDDTVGIIEAMKSFFPLEVERGGRLVRFLVKDGTEIEAGEILVEIEG